MEPLESIDPATGAPFLSVPCDSPEVVEEKLTRAAAAFTTWRATPLAERRAALLRFAEVIRSRREAWAVLMAREVGKPLAQGRGEVDKCADTLAWLAEEAERMLAPRRIPGEPERRVELAPLGVILAIMPWNFPFWQVIRCLGPALLLGNVVLLKHASQVPGCALALAEAAVEAGLPPGVFGVLLVLPSAVPGLIADPRVAKIALTGSERAGSAVAAEAGRHLKPCVLELGGSDPFLVFEDAPLERAVETATWGRLQNAGQSCIAAKRFIVEAGIARRFVPAFRAGLAAVPVGSPLDPATRLGPLARKSQQRLLHDQVTRSIQAGAQLTLGGELPEGPGAYYPATLLEGCGPGIPAWDEETFGPVAALAIARDETHAVELANASAYGLGATIFTSDHARAERVRAQLQAGMVFVNTLVRSDARVPFGGVKRSGYGRELSWAGFQELANVQTVWLEP